MTAAPSESAAAAASPDARPVRIGVSSCLLGEPVRFDGNHKRDSFLTDTLGPLVEWVSVCPEAEAGFGTPREAMRLVKFPRGVRLLTVHTAVDLTDRMERYVARRVAQLAGDDLSGYVFKKNSPSCGIERVKVYDPQGSRIAGGRGLFADAVCQRAPHLPVEEEGRLTDPVLRENFVERVFAYWRLRGLFGRRWTLGGLVAFHTAHKLTLMAHSIEAYTALGRLVAGARAQARSGVEQRYTSGFMAALARIATRRRHSNVLQHIAGHFKDLLDGASKAELAQTIADYRLGLVPLIVPITLVRHHVRVHGVPYLTGQVYLDPHPKELMLRNHV